MAVTEADRRLTELAASQHGAFTAEQARELGMTRDARRHRVRSERWIPVCPGVFRLAGTQVTWELRLFSAIAGAGETAVASHRSAAQLYRMPGFDRNVVELTVRHGTRPPSGRRRLHWSRRLPAHHVKRPSGIPATSVARTVADLAAVLHPKQAERALDTCLARRMVTVEALWRVHHDLYPSGRGGLRTLRELLEARGDGYVAPASELERRLIDLLVAANLPIPEREVDLGDGDGWIGRVEFVYRDARLLIEVDGRLHHTALLDRKHDRDRDNRFMASGWRVLRIDYDLLVHHPEKVAALIRHALKTAA